MSVLASVSFPKVSLPETGNLQQWIRHLAAEGHIAVRNPALLEQEVPVVTQGAMTDASKRAKPSDDFSAFEMVEVQEAMAPPEGYISKKTAAERSVKTSSATTSSAGVELPEGVGSLTNWGNTMCTLPKVKDRKASYSELAADTDQSTIDYLTWVKNNASKSGKMQDFANYLAAINWRETIGSKIPGTNEVRTYKTA